jgi:hypothetical protein
MNAHMNKHHGLGIHDITSLSNDKSHKEQTWAYLDIVDEIHAPSPWHLIGF